MIKQEIIKALLEVKLATVIQTHRNHEKLLHDFAQLDSNLKARQNAGEKLTKDHPDVKHILELGQAVGWDKYKSKKTSENLTKEFYEGIMLGLNYALEILNND